MNSNDPLQVFEALAARSKDDPPLVHVVPHVMRRIRATRTASEQTLAFLAAGSFITAVVAVVVGLSLLTQLSDPLEAIFQIVPPIGL